MRHELRPWRIGLAARQSSWHLLNYKQQMLRRGAPFATKSVMRHNKGFNHLHIHKSSRFLISIMSSDCLTPSGANDVRVVLTDMALACRAKALKVRAEKAENYGQKMHRLLQAMRAHLEAAQKQQEAAQQQAQSQQHQDEQENSGRLKTELSEAKQAIAAASIQAQSFQVHRPQNTGMLLIG